MGSEDSEILDDDEKSFSSINCSICLDAVTHNKGRSFAKLQCGHQFHLDCIGSAFNTKGAMQCPNCRKVEKGQWLFANGCSIPEINVEDWIRDDDLYDLSYSEMAFGVGVHWCPFRRLTGLPSSLDEGEFPSSAYHDLLSQRALFAEHAHVSSGSHPCPYAAYLGPMHPTSSNSSRNAPESSSFNSPWNGPSVPAEVPLSYGFPAIDPHSHSWEHQPVPFSNASNRIVSGGSNTDQPSAMPGSQRSGRINQEIPRSVSIMGPFFLSHGSGARARNSSTSPVIPPYPGSNARALNRIQALQAYSQQLQPSNSPAFHTPVIPISRRSGHRGVAQVPPVASSSDQTNGGYFFPSGTSSRNFPQNPQPLRFQPWDREHSSFPVNRDPSWGSYHHPGGGGSNSGSRPNNYHQEQNGSDRTPSQNW